MCGIIGIVGHDEVAARLYDGLTVLQHRGQDAAGMATIDAGRFRLHKGTGLVSDVFADDGVRQLCGRIGIGHCRYPTAGAAGSDEAQPFYTGAPYGLALAHNGNLVNTDALRRELFEQDRRHVNTGSDSEVLMQVLAHELSARGALTPEAAFAAVACVNQRVRGAYAVVALLLGLGLLAFRDPNGIRPLVLGKRETARGDEYAIASESVAFDLLGFKLLRDIRPGEAVVVTADGTFHSAMVAEPGRFAPCIFEFVYFARPDSLLDTVSVHKARMRMGQALGRKILRQMPEHDIDTVIPIPESARVAALEIANLLGVKYREGFVKNRYVGRTFIMPGQELREKSVRRKLNPIPLEFRDRVVLLVDDSIVRGTTSQQIVQMTREAGARRVYLASAAPPVRYPNIYGIDMPAAAELVAHGRSEAEIQLHLGCDWLIYQDLDELEAAVSGPRQRISGFDTSCFSGIYVTGVESDYLDRLSNARNDAAKIARGVR